MIRFLILVLTAGFLSPISALSEEKYFQCPEGSEQNCIDLLIAYGACANMKFSNNEKTAINSVQLAYFFYKKLLKDAGLNPSANQIEIVNEERLKRRSNYVDLLCPSELNTYALKRYKENVNQKGEKTFELSKSTLRDFSLTAFSKTLLLIEKKGMFKE